MSGLPPSDLSLSTLASLAELGGVRPASPAAVTAPRGGNVFSAAPVTGNSSDATETYQGGVTGRTGVTACDDDWMEREERAAILEYDGGWPRPVAEIIANKLISLKKMNSTCEKMCALDRELIALEGRRYTRERGRC